MKCQTVTKGSNTVRFKLHSKTEALATLAKIVGLRVAGGCARFCHGPGRLTSIFLDSAAGAPDNPSTLLTRWPASYLNSRKHADVRKRG